MFCMICIAIAAVVLWVKPKDHLAKLHRYATSEKVSFLGISTSGPLGFRLRVLILHGVYPSEVKTILANEYRVADGWKHKLDMTPTFVAIRGGEMVGMNPAADSPGQRISFGDLEVVELLQMDRRMEWWERAAHWGKLPNN